MGLRPYEFLILSVRRLTLDVRFSRLETVPALKRLNHTYQSTNVTIKNHYYDKLIIKKNKIDYLALKRLNCGLLSIYLKFVIASAMPESNQ